MAVKAAEEKMKSVMSLKPAMSKEAFDFLFQLLDTLNEIIISALWLSTNKVENDIFRVLDNWFGKQTVIVIEIVGELQRLSPVRSDQPKKIVSTHPSC